MWGGSTISASKQKNRERPHLFLVLLCTGVVFGLDFESTLAVMRRT